MTEYYIVVTKPKDKSLAMTEDELNAHKQHFHYVKGLQEQGKLFIAGPTKENPQPDGVMIFQADTPEEAQKILDEDPALTSKVHEVSLFAPLNIAISGY